MATVANELQAELIFGDLDRADLEVLDCKVAAMEVSLLALDQTPRATDAFAPFCGA